MAYCWYEADQSKSDSLVAGWKQFLSDLATYIPTAPTAQAVAAPTESLPAVQVSVSGQLAVISNLPEFGLALKAFIADIPKTPNTDNEFATCEAACKSLKKAEDALEQAEEYSLSQMTDVEEMRRTVANLRALARATRLAAEKMVGARKDQIRADIVLKGRSDYAEHIAGLNDSFGCAYLATVQPDFAGAIKGKKQIDSLRGAVDDLLATAKIEANAVYMKINRNISALPKEYDFLFSDRLQLVTKAPEDFDAIVSNRITEHKVKQEAERAQIAQEERERAEAAVSKAQAAQAIAKAAAPVYANKPQAKPAPASAVPTLKLGTIAERLGFGLTADFLSTLGFEPTRVKSSVLYHEHQFNDICVALVDHINSVCALQAA
jgi:signal transduction histidine kinase